MSNWNREETIVALYVYCLIPFNKANNSNSEIIEKASIINRSINSLKMKVGNFGSLDPSLAKLGIKGLTGTSHLDREIWNEYQNHWDKLAIDAEAIIAKLRNMDFDESIIQSLPQNNHNAIYKSNTTTTPQFESILNIPTGTEKERLVRLRVNQNFFRRMVLASYEEKCCVRGLCHPNLVEASHIVDWASNESERTNPCNGLCLSGTFHKAYDTNMMGITPDYTIQISDRMLFSANQISKQGKLFEYFKSLNGKKILEPNRFLPNKDLLEQHYQHYKQEN